MNPVAEMRKRALTPDGKAFKRGACSRIAEYLSVTIGKKCSHHTVKNCFLGDESGKLWKFSDARLKALGRMITLEIPLTAKKIPGRPAKVG